MYGDRLVPIYEFECKSCGAVQEVMQKISDPAPAECPACKQGPLVKLLSRTAFILKGNGWYVTDFRDGGKKSDTSGSASGSGSSASASGSSSSDSGSTASSDGGSSSDSSAKDGGSSCGPAGCGNANCS